MGTYTGTKQVTLKWPWSHIIASIFVYGVISIIQDIF